MTCQYCLDSDIQEQTFGGYFRRTMIAIHIFGWLTQFVGHFIYEQRAPALMTNLMFIFMAPFFTGFECLNYLTGYRQSDINVYNEIIEQDIAAYRLKKGLNQREGVKIEKSEKNQ